MNVWTPHIFNCSFDLLKKKKKNFTIPKMRTSIKIKVNLKIKRIGTNKRRGNNETSLISVKNYSSIKNLINYVCNFFNTKLNLLISSTSMLFKTNTSHKVAIIKYS